MKILVIGKEIVEPEKVTCFTDVFAHYLPPELRKGAEVVFSEPPRVPSEHYFNCLDLKGVDHILALGLRYWTTVPLDAFKALRARFKGLICQLYDSSRIEARCDITFSARDVSAPRTVYMGWAADSNLCFPTQGPGQLHIMIDHTCYELSPSDKSGKICESVQGFIKSEIWKGKFQSAGVSQFVDNGIRIADPKHVYPIPFHRKHIPFRQIASEYGYFSVFLPTHKESLGLCALEFAMAGALVVAPEGYIPKDRLNTIRHIEYKNEIPWAGVLQSIDVTASRAMALENSWSALGARIIDYLKSH